MGEVQKQQSDLLSGLGQDGVPGSEHLYCMSTSLFLLAVYGLIFLFTVFAPAEIHPLWILGGRGVGLGFWFGLDFLPFFLGGRVCN